MKEKKEEKIYYPILVATSGDTKETVMSKWDKFDSLSEEVKEKVSSKNTALKIRDLRMFFKLNSMQTASISRAICNYYFSEVKLEDFPVIFQREMGIDFEKSKQIANRVIRNIIEDKSIEETHQKSLVKLSLSQALKEYPKLENQQITNDFLKLHYSEFPSRPTIKNWITDYYQNLGVGNHGIMERGNFLYHSENCKKLTSVERQKLALIFKSLSENMPLAIDAEKQQIVFPEISKEQITIISKEQEAINNAQKTMDSGQKTKDTKDTKFKIQNTDESKGEIRFFSGQDMKPTPEISSKQPASPARFDESKQTGVQIESSKQSAPSAEKQEKSANAENLHFSSPQKFPAESDKKDIENSTLKIYPRSYQNGSGNNNSANTQDVKISGNIIDLKNKN
jgi:hypothetical protein